MKGTATLAAIVLLTSSSQRLPDLRINQSRPLAYLLFEKRVVDSHDATYSRVQLRLCNNSRYAIEVAAEFRDDLCSDCVSLKSESRLRDRLSDCSGGHSFVGQLIEPGGSLVFFASENCFSAGATLLVPFEFAAAIGGEEGPEMRLAMHQSQLVPSRRTCGS